MPAITDAITFLVSIGLYDVVLPFILVWTVMFALLQQTKVLGTENGHPRAPLNAMAATVIAFIALASLQTLDLLNTLSVISGVGVVIVLVILMVFSLLGVSPGSKLLLGAGFVVFFVGLLTILGKLGYLPPTLSDLTSAQYGVPFIIILVFFVVGWFIVRASPMTVEKKGEKKPQATAAKTGGTKTPGMPVSPGPSLEEMGPSLEREIGPKDAAEKENFLWGR